MTASSPKVGLATPMRRRLIAYARMPLLIVSAAVAMALFIDLLPPMLDWRTSHMARLPLFSALSADLGVYLWRFTLSFLLLGCLPWVVGRILGFGPRSLGLCAWDSAVFSWKWLGVLMTTAVIIGIVGAFDPGVAAYYPYARSLPELTRAHGMGVLALHASLYVGLYYLPWEFFFRGFLLQPLVGLLAPQARAGLTPESVALVSIQVIPSVLLHVGHPLSETLGAIPFGLALGVLALRTRSILPGLLLHAAIGLATDTTLVMKQLGDLH